MMIVLVRVFVRGRGCASLAVHPAGIPVDVVLFLPDRYAMLHFVDDEPAGPKRLVAVHGADSDPDRDVADRQRPDAMYAGGAGHAKFFDGGLHDARAFLLGELGEGLVFEACDRVAFVVIAHPAFEGGEPAAAVVAQLALPAPRAERQTTEKKLSGSGGPAHPPATG